MPGALVPRAAPHAAASSSRTASARFTRKHHANYGAPRIHRELVAQGYACNRKTVEKLMCRAGIRAETCRRFRVMTTDSRHSLPIAPNRLARQFGPRKRHQAWTMDITYIDTDEGWLYLAVVETCTRGRS